MRIQNLRGSETSQMRAEWQDYFRNTPPGTQYEWGGGTLTMRNDGTAQYRALDAMNGGDVFDVNVNLENISRYNPGIARQWYKQYGFTTSDNQWFFGGRVINGADNMMNWRVQPGMAGTGWSGSDGNGNYKFDMDLMQIWMRDTGTSYDPYKLQTNYTPSAAPAGSYTPPVVNTNTGEMVVNPAFPVTDNPLQPVTGGAFPTNPITPDGTYAPDGNDYGPAPGGNTGVVYPPPGPTASGSKGLLIGAALLGILLS